MRGQPFPPQNEPITSDMKREARPGSERNSLSVLDSGAGGVRSLRPLSLVVLLLSALVAGFVLLDPLGVWLARSLHPAVVRFFEAFTGLGRASWLLWPSVIGAFYLAFLVRYGDWRDRLAARLAHLAAVCGYVFAAIASAGLVVNLLKAAIGRARPEHFDRLGPLAFQPFRFSSEFASFPSGHSATAFAIAASLGAVWPALRCPLLVIAFWIAFSRVATGAHYVTDTIAGALIGLAAAFLWRGWFAEREMIWRLMPDGSYRTRKFGRAP